ncbi:MAG: 4-(cytidine 5'-diphospho)-2-C-methyl-D-erythritol kinase [Flavobacteriales bacterium]
MILFPPAKINLGLHVLAKRQDGYHEIETIMAEIPLFDILELNEASDDSFTQTGIIVPSDGQPNLCERAVALLRAQATFPAVSIHLRKQIPIGAGLGGGSADASYTLKGLNDLFKLGFSNAQLAAYAAQLGSDCPFFIEGGLQLAKGRGEQLQNLPAFQQKVQLVLCNPQLHVSTAQAYSGVKPNHLRPSLPDLLRKSGLQQLQNDFEESVFEVYPQINQLKRELLDSGAFYAAMSGSGSSVYGLFAAAHPIVLSEQIERFVIYCGEWSF